MNTLAIICIILTVICFGLNILEEDWSGVMGWGCAVIWAMNWFLKPV